VSDFDLSQFSWDHDPVDELTERTVLWFMDQMREGKPIKAPVLMRLKSGRFTPVDGFKRLEACRRLGKKTVKAYQIEELSDKDYVELRRALNEDNTLRN